MSSFTASITFDLDTTVDPDGVEGRLAQEGRDIEGAQEVEDNSYFSSEDVSVSGGSIEVKLEAEDEDAADEAVRAVYFDGAEVEDYNGVTWVLDSVSIDIERDEMTEDEAKEVVRELLNRLANSGQITSVESEAIAIVLELS